MRLSFMPGTVSPVPSIAATFSLNGTENEMQNDTDPESTTAEETNSMVSQKLNSKSWFSKCKKTKSGLGSHAYEFTLLASIQ